VQTSSSMEKFTQHSVPDQNAARIWRYPSARLAARCGPAAQRMRYLGEPSGRSSEVWAAGFFGGAAEDADPPITRPTGPGQPDAHGPSRRSTDKGPGANGRRRAGVA